MINLFKLAALAKTASKPVPMPEFAADKLAQEKMTRRAALRRIGMTGAMTVIGVMSIDDLARISAKKLEEHEMTKGLAKDFKNAGVAVAGPRMADEEMVREDLTEQQQQGDSCHDDCYNTLLADRVACGPVPVAPNFPSIDYFDAYAYFVLVSTRRSWCRSAAMNRCTACYNRCPPEGGREYIVE